MLNPNHKSSLRATCQTVDESLERVMSLLDSSWAASPFSPVARDASPIQHRVISDYVTRVRKAMREALEAFGIELFEPSRSSVWAAQTALLSAAIAMEEVRPKHLRGYGRLAEEDAELVTLQVGKIHDLLERMQEYLAQGSGGDLQSRIAHLADTNGEVELLRKLEAVITRRGLIEFRGTLEMLLDRMEANTFEVAVFGRVSSGKSSLLDYILDTDVLPVGVTPVTAVPTRISYGKEPRAIIHFAERKPAVVAPERLFEYAAEQQNPANAKHVTRIQVELPARRLQEGITLVDTPGIGSLALVGAAESMAYLPRCDLGLVMVDSGSTLIAEDVALVDLLHRCGAAVQVLLSKSDLLSESDRTQAAQYVEEQLQKQIGASFSVFPVSVVGTAAAWCEDWLEKSLLPQLAQHKRLAQESLQRKIAGLQNTVVKALHKRAVQGNSIHDDSNWAQTDSGLVAAGLQLENTTMMFRESLAPVRSVANHLFDRAAERLAQAPSKDAAYSPDAQAEILRLLTESYVQMAAERERLVRAAQERLLEVLRHVSPITDEDTSLSKLIEVHEMPVPEQDASPLQVTLKRTWRNAIGLHGSAANLKKQLQTALGKHIESDLANYAKRLDSWCLAALQELQRAFTARSDLVRAAAGDISRQDQPGQVETDLAELHDFTGNPVMESNP